MNEKLKRLLLSMFVFIVSCIAIYYGADDVQAASYLSHPLSNINTPVNFAFTDLSSTGYATLNADRFWAFNGDDVGFYYASLTQNATLGTYGIGITLQSNIAMQKGSTYSLTMVFGVPTSSYIIGPEYSNYKLKVGVSDGWNAIDRAAEVISYAANTPIGLDNLDYLTGDSYLLSYNVTFKPNYSGAYLFTAFSANKSVTVYNGNFDFLGYYISYIGDTNVSAGDIANSVDNVLQDDFSDVDQKLSALDKTLSDVGSSVDKQTEEQRKQHQETMDTLTDSSSEEASDSAGSFFSGFTSNEHGLTSIITAPLTLIKSITSQKCSPLSLEVPFLKSNNKLNLPCMSTIYEKNFGSVLKIYQTVTFGIVAYWVCVKCYAMVKGFQNPDDDKIEVLDL